MSAFPKQAPADAATVLFYVQHLLGIGHLQRASVIARALGQAGMSVVMACGGVPVPGLNLGSNGGSNGGAVRVVQLPPVRVLDEHFSALVDREGRPIDAAWKAARAAELVALLHQVKPKILLFELFPFGRRKMSFELLPLLDAAQAMRPPPRVICSLRDILNTAESPEKTDWALATLERYFDLVLVHGDPAFLPLERSFPRVAEIASKIRYTGYVVAPAPARGSAPAPEVPEVIVSTGGGAIGEPLIEAALAARPLGPLAHVPWRILVGHNLPEARFDALVRRAPSGVVMERARPDFRSLLADARLSISQAGYNTVLEVLASGVPAVLAPFSRGTETEQDQRARALAERGAVVLVEDSTLSAETLAAGIRRALAPTARSGAGVPGLKINGGAETGRILRDLAMPMEQRR